MKDVDTIGAHKFFEITKNDLNWRRSHRGREIICWRLLRERGGGRQCWPSGPLRQLTSKGERERVREREGYGLPSSRQDIFLWTWTCTDDLCSFVCHENSVYRHHRTLSQWTHSHNIRFDWNVSRIVIFIFSKMLNFRKAQHNNMKFDKYKHKLEISLSNILNDVTSFSCNLKLTSHPVLNSKLWN